MEHNVKLNVFLEKIRNIKQVKRPRFRDDFVTRHSYCFELVLDHNSLGNLRIYFCTPSLLKDKQSN